MDFLAIVLAGAFSLCTTASCCVISSDFSSALASNFISSFNGCSSLISSAFSKIGCSVTEASSISGDEISSLACSSVASVISSVAVTVSKASSAQELFPPSLKTPFPF